jgi:hypothetical protein
MGVPPPRFLEYCSHFLPLPHLSYFLLTDRENVTGLFGCITLELHRVKYLHRLRLSQNSVLRRQPLSDLV